MDFYSAFKALIDTGKAGMDLRTLIKDASGHKRKVLLELQENIDLISLAKEKGFDIDKVITKLERKYYLSAVEADFNFNSLKRSVLKEKTINGVPQFIKYLGWSTQRLFINIYRKVKQLQDIVEMDSENKNINKKARLENIYRMMILIINHLKS